MCERFLAIAEGRESSLENPGIQVMFRSPVRSKSANGPEPAFQMRVVPLEEVGGTGNVHRRVLQIIEKVFLVGLEIFEKFLYHAYVIGRIRQAGCLEEKIFLQGIDSPERDGIRVGTEGGMNRILEFQRELIAEFQIGNRVAVLDCAGERVLAARRNPVNIPVRE
ncbi:hypothetical protein A2753_02045 [Candidatus Uhrbacteria bacterium RIFCSPHIGHO2_01_FULL_47_11]|nr:MAG: hypothetical protein A2753_02045 [Candidatus Uhrbacteria bacterium RIFCSPHIGHO2_01_FULL_47_11]